MKNKKTFFICYWYCTVFLFFSLFLGGCVVGVSVNSGGLQRGLEAEQFFTKGTILPDHTYYIQGTRADPEAIIAVRNSFQLRSSLWSQVDWSEKELADAVFWMQTEDVGFCSTDGGYLVAPDGTQVGIWYSQRNLATVKQPEPGVVEVYPFDYMYGSPCHRVHLLDEL